MALHVKVQKSVLGRYEKVELILEGLCISKMLLTVARMSSKKAVPICIAASSVLCLSQHWVLSII